MFRRSLLQIIASRSIFFRSFSSKSSAILRHNWFEINAEIVPSDSSQLSRQPDPKFNQQLIEYLCQSAREKLPTKVEENLLENFRHWSPQELYDLVALLGGFGLQPVDVLRWLKAVPSADKTIIHLENVKRCLENLLHLKLDSTSRAILLSNDPNLIQYDLSYIRERFDVLQCYFTKREILKLIRKHRTLFSEQWKDLDYKINYLRIMLFASTRDIVESGALSYSIDHIRQRYLFVARCGLYKRVRRDDQYLVQRDFNLSLSLMFDSSLSRFLKETTNNLLRAEDYQAFVDSLVYENFDNEFDKYLTLEKTRKKWNAAERYAERQERRHWMSEFDMFNNEEIEDDDQGELILMEENSLVERNNEETQPSLHHPLSNWSRDRHQREKLARKSDPNLRF